MRTMRKILGSDEPPALRAIARVVRPPACVMRTSVIEVDAIRLRAELRGLRRRAIRSCAHPGRLVAIDGASPDLRLLRA